MSVVTQIQELIKKGQIDQPKFLRISYYTAEKELLTTAAKGYEIYLELLKQPLSKMKIRQNASSFVLIGETTDGILVNLSAGCFIGEQSELLKVELAGSQGLIQYDSSTENAFQVPKGRLFTKESPPQVIQQVKNIMEGKNV